jgi:nitrogenase molybdenum-iron protein alpha/beta subunit
MKQRYYEEISDAMYPAQLLHQFGVNGKISGSVYAVGEIEGAVAIIHSPTGCGYHYRYSARRRNYPNFDVYSSEISNQEIIFGGCEKLLKKILEVWNVKKPKLIVVIPSPVSDIIQDDLNQCVNKARVDFGVNVVSVNSELFSHRDKSFARKRLKELSKNKMGKCKKIDFDILGCGYVEVLYSLVDNVMKQQPINELYVNIETIGWGASGKKVLLEIEEILEKVGVKVHSYFPSTTYEKIVEMPKASLNIVKRLRWAKHMENKFGTPYIILNTAGFYSGLDGICRFYEHIGNKLNISEKMDSVVEKKKLETLYKIANKQAYFSQKKAVIVTRNIQKLPHELKKYAVDCKFQVKSVILILSDQYKRNMNVDEELLKNFIERFEEVKFQYSPETELFINPDEEEKNKIITDCDVILGAQDFRLEKFGIPVVQSDWEEFGLSFESYIRTIDYIFDKLERGIHHKNLLVDKIGFKDEYFPLPENNSLIATREMWSKMWLHREEEQND